MNIFRTTVKSSYCQIGLHHMFHCMLGVGADKVFIALLVLGLHPNGRMGTNMQQSFYKGMNRFSEGIKLTTVIKTYIQVLEGYGR